MNISSKRAVGRSHLFYFPLLIIQSQGNTLLIHTTKYKNSTTNNFTSMRSWSLWRKSAQCDAGELYVSFYDQHRIRQILPHLTAQRSLGYWSLWRDPCLLSWRTTSKSSSSFSSSMKADMGPALHLVYLK